MPGFYIPVSGLDADTTSLNTIANNLSNMSTTGFKSQTTNFSDLFYQELGANGSGDQTQVGTGVQVASNSTDFTTGAISSTGISTDAAINGTGFFILQNGGSQLYTRAGDFQLSSTGVLQTTTGQSVMGYAATNGVINQGSGLTELSVPVGAVQPPAATQSFSMTQNLNSSAAVGTVVTGQVQVYDSLGTSYEATVTYTKLPPTVATSTADANPNNWSYKITLPDTVQPATTSPAGVPTYTYTFGSTVNSSVITPEGVDAATNLTIHGPLASGLGSSSVEIPPAASGETPTAYAADITAALAAAGITASAQVDTTGTQITIAGTGVTVSGSVIADPVVPASASTINTGTLTFDSAGNLLSPASDVTGVSFQGLSDGATALNMTWDLTGNGGGGTISQTSAASSTSASTQDGYASGEYQSFSVNSTGQISATYSNGQTQTVGQFAIATVSNEQGLEDVGSTEYQTTGASGNASIGTAGAGGRGSLEGSSLEASNVNISSEFSDLIVAQRAFEANSKSITTFDTITQETINMIH
jgi:flagellar hook protein FlgE